ncbi:unnamed protein product (macronuclear) [Paramecium tetraurelia]|uniref:Uncharacterized protein n=1 Tax=Paramecium tetraurelia TaxID=5888 RepID=A0CB93_PARTE|nr:uncharacterized protein GSPATT00036843001 [Paramecium tetraurelia]CAK68060.1 unnamed protein product [Paramecium tetraurelia]|eukprot:XP_001435457.1 hypothetical protein (macronuclear) [Paramecium tetraurelia strain d4-2]
MKSTLNFKYFLSNKEIDEITSDDVTVSLTKVPADFSQQVQVGFQIILGPKEAFQNFLFIDSTDDYIQLIEEVQNSWFLSLFTGMGYPYTDAVRLDKQYWYQGASTYEYSLKTCKIFSQCQGTVLLLLALILMDFFVISQIQSFILQI